MTALPAVASITIAWLIALVLLLLTRESLAEADRTWWIAVAAAGSLTGVLALAYLGRRARRLRVRADSTQE